MTDLEKRKEKPASIVSHEVGEVQSVSLEESGKRNWFLRNVVDGFKPPVDDADFADLSPTERGRLYLSRTEPKLHRRHLMVMSLASFIGTGLFIGSGSSLKTGGPAALIIGFIVLGYAVLLTIYSVGEIAIRYPMVNLLYEAPSRFIHPSIGFAVGWVYCFGTMVSAPTELIAATELAKFWSGDHDAAAHVNPVAWVALVYGLDCIIQLSGTRLYGEVEFVVGSIKVLGVTGFIFFSIINVCGGPPTGHYIGATNFHPGFLHSFKGVVQVMVSCSFALGGAEIAGIAAAETENPMRSIPSAVRQTFWRITLLFILSIFMVCLMVPATTDGLGNSNSGSGSPFVLAFKLTGVKACPSIFNAVILCSMFGVSNSCIYMTARTLTSLALHGANLRWFCYIDRQGRPLVSICATLIFLLLGFVCASSAYNDVFNWLYAFASLGYLYAWLALNICALRVRYCMKLQKGSLDGLFWKSPLGMWSAIIGGGIMLATLGLQFWIYLFPIGSDPSAKEFFESDLSVPFFIFLVCAHKIWKRKDAVFTSNRELDLDSGVREINVEELKEQIMIDKALARKSVVRFFSTYLC